MRSIMQVPDGRCYFCEILGDYSEKPVEEHHCIFGTSGRRLSTKFGLTVWLCPHHHRTSKLSVHQNHELAAYLQDKAQRCFESYFPDKNFLLEFGKNYKLTSEERCNALKILRGNEYENDS